MKDFALVEDLKARNTIIIYNENISYVAKASNPARSTTSFNPFSTKINIPLGQVLFIDTVDIDVKDKTKVLSYDLGTLPTTATVYDEGKVESFTSATVADNNFSQITVSGLTTLMASSNLTKTENLSISNIYHTNYLINSDSKLISGQSYQKIKTFINPINVNVTCIKEKLLFEPSSIIVTYGEVSNLNSKTNLNSASVNVDNNVPINPGTITGGSGLKNLNLHMQVGSFYKMDLDFNNIAVKNISGLPSGLEFVKAEKCIKGSPTNAGKYPLRIIFENDTYLPGLLEIPILDREW